MDTYKDIVDFQSDLSMLGFNISGNWKTEGEYNWNAHCQFGKPDGLDNWSYGIEFSSESCLREKDSIAVVVFCTPNGDPDCIMYINKELKVTTDKENFSTLPEFQNVTTLEELRMLCVATIHRWDKDWSLKQLQKQFPVGSKVNLFNPISDMEKECFKKYPNEIYTVHRVVKDATHVVCDGWHFNVKAISKCLYITEQPDLKIPEGVVIPEGFEDWSWHNDSMASWHDSKLHVCLWIDYEKKDSEFGDCEETDDWTWTRFGLEQLDDEDQHTDDYENNELLKTNDWSEVVKKIKSLRKGRE